MKQTRPIMKPNMQQHKRTVKLTQTNYVDEAEKAVANLCRDRNGRIMLTTSKIRNLLSMISAIYNEVTHFEGKELNDDLVEKLQYLRMRFAYEAGREKTVKNLVEQADIFGVLERVGKSKEQCLVFCHYMESIVAYHKYNDGKD